MILDLIKLKYIRNPCKKCLVQPACKEECYKVKIHRESMIILYNNSLAIFIAGNVFLLIKLSDIIF